MNEPVFQPEVPATMTGVLGRLTRLTLKELREILRDRRTIFTLVLMPLLVYPLLSIGFRQFYLASALRDAETEYRLGFVNESEANWFLSYTKLDRQGPPLIKTYVDPAIISKLGGKDSALDAVVVCQIAPPGEAGSDAETRATDSLAVDCEIVIVPGSVYGERLATLLERQIAKANEGFLDVALHRLGSSQRAVPLQAKRRELASSDEAPALSIITLLPLVLILMTITGAVYPAIDLTAGERERGTLEILVSAPVPRIGLLLAKYVTVLTVALLTAAVNLASMTVTVVLGGLTPLLLGKGGWSPWLIAEVMALLVLFASFFSAVLLSLTSFARSFKEAQAYLIPLMLLSLAPGLVAMTPGMQLTGLRAVTPLLNIVLLARDLLEQRALGGSAAIVVLSTMLYAAAAIALAARVFGSEDVLYGSQASTADWFRRPATVRPAPTLASALTCLALLFPAFYVVSGAIAQWSSSAIEVRLLWSSLATALLFGGFPWLAAWLGRDDIPAAFQLRRPKALAVLGAVFLGLSVWTVAHEIVVIQHQIGLIPLETSQLEKAREVIAKIRQLPIAAVVLALGIMPGLFEELFFRGFLLKALLAQTTRRRAIVFSAVLFGLFHLIATDSLAVERFLPSTFMGLVLGWLCCRTGSVWPGVVLHATHNSFLVCVTYYEQQLLDQGLGTVEQQHLPVLWLLAAAVAAGIGFALVLLAGKSSASNR